MVPCHVKMWQGHTEIRSEVQVRRRSRSFLITSNCWDIWCVTPEKGSYVICGQSWPRSACASAQADLGHRCPLTESVSTVVYVDEQKFFSDCTDAHADLDLRCPQNE